MDKVDYALLLVHQVCHINIVNLMNLNTNVLTIVILLLIRNLFKNKFVWLIVNNHMLNHYQIQIQLVIVHVFIR